MTQWAVTNRLTISRPAPESPAFDAGLGFAKPSHPARRYCRSRETTSTTKPGFQRVFWTSIGGEYEHRFQATTANSANPFNRIHIDNQHL
jgi:hypothetical protein